MKYIILTICLTITSLTYAQKVSYGHQHTSRMIDAAYLTTASGIGGKLGFTKNNDNFSISQYALSLETGTEKYMDYMLIGADYNHMWNLIDIKKTFYINLGPGAQIGYESLESQLTTETKNGIILGLSGKAELEFFINKVALFVNAQQYYLPVSNMGDWRLKMHFGLKYVIK